MHKVVDQSSDADAVAAVGPIAPLDARDILRLRYWQHLLNEKMKEKNWFKIPIHLAFGHEAVAVAIDRCMGANDAMCLSHRNAAYNLIRAKSLAAVLAHYELTTRTRTNSLMGSMNLAVPDTGIAYASSILGNNLPVAAGIAMNRAVRKEPGVVFVFTGDGAMEEGVFWETLIFSRSHRLPLVIIVENDNHSMSSTIAQRRSDISLAKVCDGVGVQYLHGAGSSLGVTKHVIQVARAAAVAGDPACVELSLSTFNQHAGPTPGWPDDPLNISLKNGLIVADSQEDPVYQVKNALGRIEYDRLAREVLELSELADDVH